jgi:hypothetical protein
MCAAYAIAAGMLWLHISSSNRREIKIFPELEMEKKYKPLQRTHKREFKTLVYLGTPTWHSFDNQRLGGNRNSIATICVKIERDIEYIEKNVITSNVS